MPMLRHLKHLITFTGISNFKVNIHSIQAPGNPSDNFDTGEVIKSETWISTDIEITPWEVYEEDYDL